MKIVVPYPPGGGSDRAARIVAEEVGDKGSAPLITDLIGGHVPVAILAMKATPVSSDRARAHATVEAFRQRWEPTIRRSGLNFD